MMCEICRLRPATVATMQVRGQHKARVRACPWCAQPIQSGCSSVANDPDANGSPFLEEAEERLSLLSSLSDEAMQVLESAAERALDAHQAVMTPEMLLAAMLTDESLHDWVAESLAIDTEAVLAQLTLPERLEGAGRLVESIRFGARLKRVLHVAHKTALAAGDGPITAKHLLAGVLADSKGLAAQVLHAAMGVTPDTAHPPHRQA